MVRLPPLKALKAFEISATHLSIRKAAEELCVTPAAVSHQIKLLETALGAKMFERTARGLALTRDGRALFSATRRAFNDIADAIEAIQVSLPKKTVTIHSLPHFSAKVLMQGRASFAHAHPHIELNIINSLSPPNFNGEERIDFAIRFGLLNRAPLDSDLLLASDAAPACAPQLAAGAVDPHQALSTATLLLDDDSFHEIWVEWFRVNAFSGWERLKFTRCDDIHVLLEAAADGYGYILEPDFMIDGLLKSGRLVKPFEALPVRTGYFLTADETAMQRIECRAFKDWFVDYVSGRQRHSEV